MKVLKKKLMAGLLTVAVAVSVLGTVTPVSAASLTAKQYLTKMEKASQKAKSYEVTQTVSLKASQAGQSMTSKTTAKQTVFQKPLKSKLVTTSKVTAEGVDQESKVVAYIKEDEQGNIFEYISTDGSEYEEVDLTDMYSSASELDTSLYSDLKIAKKSVKVNKIDTVQISAKIKGADMGKALTDLGVTGDEIADLGVDFKTLDPIKVTLWIDKKTYLPVKATTDMVAFYNDFFKSMYEALEAEMDVSYSVAKTTLTYKNFNKATEFKFPNF